VFKVAQELDIWKKILETTTDIERDADVDRLAEELVTRAKPRLKMALMALIMSRARRSAALMAQIDQVEAELFGPEGRVTSASPAELARLLRTLKGSQVEDIKMMQSGLSLQTKSVVPNTLTSRRQRLEALVAKSGAGRGPSRQS
jgi:ATP-dependent DNA ligase